MGHTLPVFCNHQASAQVGVNRKTLALEAEKQLSVFLSKEVFGALAVSSWWLTPAITGLWWAKIQGFCSHTLLPKSPSLWECTNTPVFLLPWCTSPRCGALTSWLVAGNCCQRLRWMICPCATVTVSWDWCLSNEHLYLHKFFISICISGTLRMFARLGMFHFQVSEWVFLSPSGDFGSARQCLFPLA